MRSPILTHLPLRALASLLVVASLPATSACSWSRFNDLKEKAPAVEFSDPAGLPGFGTTMATVPIDNDTLLLVVGEPNLSPGAVAYRINNDSPSLDPVDGSFCPGRCLFGASPAPLRAWTTSGGPQQACFMIGTGDYNGEVGLIGRCAGAQSFVLPVPGRNEEFPTLPFAEDAIKRDLNNASLGQIVAGDVELGSSHDAAPILVAATRSINAAWYYAHGTSEPKPLTLVPVPGTMPEEPRIKFGDTFGASIAVAAVPQGGHLIAISAPSGVGADDNGRVWLYREQEGAIVHGGVDQSVPQPWGCIPGVRPNFGAFMHTAQVLGDEVEELLVSDGKTLSIYDTSVLAESFLGDSCGGPLTTPGAFVTGLSCVETDAVSGCAAITSDFGRAVAAADVDGDGRNELLVGTSAMAVHGTSGAGAVLVYRVDEAGQDTRLLEARYLSSAATGDALGGSVAALRIGARDVVAAGAPGLSSFFVFFCSTLGGAGADSFRCR